MVEANLTDGTNTFHSQGEIESLNCRECNSVYKTREALYSHLLHHVKQPKVILERHQITPLKLTIQNTKENGYRVVYSPTLPITPITAESTSPTATAVAETPPAQTAVDETQSEQTAEAPKTNGDTLADICDTLDVEFDLTDELADTDVTLSNTEEDIEDAMISEYDARNKQTEVVIPGGEPTPPPDTPELPKIRIKTGLLQSNRVQPDNAARSTTPSASAGCNDIMSSLFTNNDRAKDLGFTTIDPDFNPADIVSASPQFSQSRALISNSSNNNSTNPLASLRNLPINELTQQVSRMQPSNVGGMHQQNVLINIQQFPTPVQPTPHQYPTQMYHPPQPQPQPPPPMYGPAPPLAAMPYQYPNQQIYYQQPQPYHPPPHPHMPPQQQSVIQQQHAQMRQQQLQHQQQQQQLHQQQQQQQQQQQLHRPPMQQPSRPPHPGGMHHQSQQMQAPAHRMPPPPIYHRQPAPTMRPPPHNVPQRRPNVCIRPRLEPRPPRMPILQEALRSPNESAPPAPPGKRRLLPKIAPSQAPASKRVRIDNLMNGQNDDADCQVVAVSKKTSSMPQIQSIHGNVGNADNLHLPEKVTQAVKEAESAHTEAKEVADVLAARGITVTTTANCKPKDSRRSSTSPASKDAPVAINLNEDVCIITPNNAKKKDDKISTVDLTQEENAQRPTNKPKAGPPPKQPQNQSGGGGLECHLCPSKFADTKLLMKHRKLYHRTTTGPEFGIPLIDLKIPGITQRLTNYGIFHYIPLPNASPHGMYALPILSPAAASANRNTPQDLISSVLTLGPVQPIKVPRPIVRKVATNPKNKPGAPPARSPGPGPSVKK